MLQPVKRGSALREEMEQADAREPWLWWLGHSGFAIKYYDIVFYLDPLLRDGLTPDDAAAADMILCSHAHERHLDPATVGALLAQSTKAKVVLPKSAADRAHEAGIAYDRMTTTDSGLRVEYFKNGVYARMYAVPSAHPA